MAKVWKEPYNPQLHRNKMVGLPVQSSPDAKLVPRWVYFVRVCSFTFEFHSLEQLEVCRDYYQQKIHASSRLPVNTQNYGDHWEALRWYEMLPMYLLEEPKRVRLVKALNSAVEQFISESHRRAAQSN